MVVAVVVVVLLVLVLFIFVLVLVVVVVVVVVAVVVDVVFIVVVVVGVFAAIISGVATLFVSQDILLFQKLLASMDLLTPAEMLREVGRFVSCTEGPREKLNCTEFLKAVPESDVVYKQLTFQGKMAAANVVKDIAVKLEPGCQQIVSVPDTKSMWKLFF